MKYDRTYCVNPQTCSLPGGCTQPLTDDVITSATKDNRSISMTSNRCIRFPTETANDPRNKKPN